MSNCSQLCPGMLLITLGVLTHIWFLHFGHSEIVNVLLFGVDEKGHELFCWDWLFTTPPCFDFDYFICHWCLWKYRTPCLNVITFGFFCLNPILHNQSPPLLTHGLILEVELFMLTDQHLLLFPSPNYFVFFNFIYFFSIPFPTCCPANITPSPDISHPEFCSANVPPSPDISHPEFCRPTFHLLRIFYIRRLTSDGRGGRFNFPNQTCPDPLIALTRRVFLSVYNATVFSWSFPICATDILRFFCFRYLLSKSPKSPCNPPIIGFLSL